MRHPPSRQRRCLAALVVGADDLPGATIAGGPGFDTLTLTGGGVFDLTLPAIFTGVSTVQGSAAHDTIRIDAARYAGVAAFEGGPGAATTWNELVLVGDAFDLTGKTFAGISRISLSTDGAVLTVTGGDAAAKALALRTGGLLSQHDTLKALGLTFTTAEIAALHRQGLDTIRDAAGPHVNAAPVVSGLDGTPLQALAGARVFVDAGRNAAITDDDPSLSLLVVEAPAGPAAPGRLGLDVSGAVSLSGVLAPGSLVRVGGVEIGMVWDAGPSGLRVALGPDATPARVSVLLRALTYTFADVLPTADVTPAISITLSDEGGRVSRASVAIAGIPEPETAHLALSHAHVTEGARDGTVVGLLTALAAGNSDGFTYTPRIRCRPPLRARRRAAGGGGRGAARLRGGSLARRDGAGGEGRGDHRGALRHHPRRRGGGGDRRRERLRRWRRVAAGRPARARARAATGCWSAARAGMS